METSEIKPWMQALSDDMSKSFERAFQDSDEYPKAVYAEHYFDDECFIEIKLGNTNEIEVFLCDNNGNKKDCPNVVRYINENLPSWEDFIQEYKDNCQPFDEWTEHGFRDEADYWRWKMKS